MAALRLLLACAACITVAQASNATTTTLATTTTAYNANANATTVTTTTDGATTTAALQETISGTISLTITGDCAAFVNDADVQTAVKESIASVCSLSSSYVAVSMAHSCSSRRLSKYGRGRRLDGTVTVDYTITLPLGSSVTGASISNLITSTSTSAWQSTLATKLSDLSVTGYTVTVASVGTPTVGTIAAFTTITTTTTLGAGIDSSALTKAVFSSAHVWLVLAMVATSKLF